MDLFVCHDIVEVYRVSKLYLVLTLKTLLLIDGAIFTRAVPSVASYFEDAVFRSWARDRLFRGFSGVTDFSQASTEIVPLITTRPP